MSTKIRLVCAMMTERNVFVCFDVKLVISLLKHFLKVVGENDAEIKWL